MTFTPDEIARAHAASLGGVERAEAMAKLGLSPDGSPLPAAVPGPGAGSAPPADSAADDGTRWCLCCQVRPARLQGVWCGRKCRQAVFRLRGLLRRHQLGNPDPSTFAYADPAYFKLSRKFYGKEPDFAGEVDHAELVRSLVAGGFRGFGLSLSVAWDSLVYLIPLINSLVPQELYGKPRFCAWTKPHGVPSTTLGPHNTWEGLIIVGGRRLPPGVPDSLRALPARGWSSLMGRKPLAFCAWFFDLMGMLPGDRLVDVFMGSDAVARAWRVLSPRSSTTPTPEQRKLLRARLLPSLTPALGEEEPEGAPPPVVEQLSLLQAGGTR